MHCKSYSHFLLKKFQHICISLDVNFNESLTNDVVSFEQLGPVEGGLRVCSNGHAVVTRKAVMPIQSNFNGSNIFGTMEICSRHG